MCSHRSATWEAVVLGRLSLNEFLRFFPIVKKHFTLTEMTTINNFTIRINKKWNLELCIVIIKHET
jgi:predicted component of type VI protein secretion system